MLISLLCLICFISGAVWDVPVRMAARLFFQKDYGTHVFNCDNAMREHFIAKSRVSKQASPSTVTALQASEVALIDCHQYDKFRKRLIGFGLNENDLAIMGLKAIEEKKSDLSKLVREHEIRY
jgi:hypothetical protein